MMKKIIIAILVCIIALIVFKKNDMTLRQSLLKVVYPVFMLKQKVFSGSNGIIENIKHAAPLKSFYELVAEKNSGENFSFAQLKGKKVLIVNTASDCGYTQQYEELQELYHTYQSKLVIIAFPANNFKQQEKANDKEIEQFCKVNFGVTFPLMKKSSVKKGEEQNPVFLWLSDKTLNGWNNKAPEWNFSKYLINENGVLTHYFAPKVSPLSKELMASL